MTRLLMLVATFAVIATLLGPSAQSAPISICPVVPPLLLAVPRLSGSDSAAAGFGRQNARCVGARERGGLDVACGDTAAGGRLFRRHLLRRSDLGVKLVNMVLKAGC